MRLARGFDATPSAVVEGVSIEVDEVDGTTAWEIVPTYHAKTAPTPEYLSTCPLYKPRNGSRWRAEKPDYAPMSTSVSE